MLRTAPAPADISVNVFLYPDGLTDTGRIDFSVGNYSPPGVTAAADATLGLTAARDRVTAEAKRLEPAAKYNVLREQIEGAEARVRAANKTFERVRAAKKLLEDNPEPDLANKLRAIESQLAAAEADKTAAEADLSVIRRLAPALYAAAANAVGAHAEAKAMERALALREPREQAEAKLDDARQQLEAVIRKAVAEIVAPAMWQLLVARRAATQAHTQSGRFSVDVTHSVLGPVPAGVRMMNGRFEPAPSPPTGDASAA